MAGKKKKKKKKVPSAREKRMNALQARMTDVGITISELARRLGLGSPTTLNGWLKKGVIPENRADAFAEALGTDSGDLIAAGFKVRGTYHPRSRNSPSSVSKEPNIMPLLKAVVESGVKKVSFDDLRVLSEHVARLEKRPSPAAIALALAMRE